MPDTVGLVVAALGGAAVGLERQWSGHADGPGARFAGIRTFTLLGTIAGLSGWLSAAGLVPAATALLAGAIAITVIVATAGIDFHLAGVTVRSHSWVYRVMFPPTIVCRVAPKVPMIERERTTMPRTSPNVWTVVYPSIAKAVVVMCCMTGMLPEVIRRPSLEA